MIACIRSRMHEFFLFQGFEFEVLHGGVSGIDLVDFDVEVAVFVVQAAESVISGQQLVDGILIVLEHTDPPDSADFISLLIKARSADGLRQVL